MVAIHSLPVAIAFCVITMLGWGSWANTQKLTGRAKWPFELFYWDYVLGILLCSIVFAATLGSHGSSGVGVWTNFQTAGHGAVHHALVSGAIFNVSNVLLVVGIDAAGMAVAFPVGVGLALVIGTVESYVQSPKGDPRLLFTGVALILFAMVMSAFAHARLPQSEGRKRLRGLAFSIVAGCVMGAFYPQLMRSISPDFNSVPISPGMLTPYLALVFFGVGVLVSNIVVNTILMRAGNVSYAQYLDGSSRVHFIGILGGFIWMIALTCNVIASGVAGPAVSYALGQGATLIAAIWGVLIWREFRSAPKQTTLYIALMFVGYTAGLILIGAATH